MFLVLLARREKGKKLLRVIAISCHVSAYWLPLHTCFASLILPPHSE